MASITSTSRQPSSVLIVGAGVAGNCVAYQLRHHGYRGPITMVEATCSSRVTPAEGAAAVGAGRPGGPGRLPVYPPSFFEAEAIDLVRGRRATRIDRGARRVVLEDGAALPYDAIVLAMGETPDVRCDYEIDADATVRYLRGRADVRGVREAAARARRVVFLDVDLEALELAASVAALGIAVTICGDAPLVERYGPELGAFVRGLHEANGVDVVDGGVSAIEPHGVLLRDGTRVAADLVVVRPDVPPMRGPHTSDGTIRVLGTFEVNEYLETQLRAVHACGETAKPITRLDGGPPPALLPARHWTIAHRQGEIVAHNILAATDADRVRLDVIPFTWTRHDSLGVGLVGDTRRWERIEVDGALAEGRARVTYFDAESAIAIATVGEPRMSEPVGLVGAAGVAS